MLNSVVQTIQPVDTEVIFAHKYLNGLGSEKLECLCDSILKKGKKRIIVNFNQTELINSIGISILIGIIEKVKNADGHLDCCHLSKIHFDLFDMLGITSYMHIYPSLEDALNNIKQYK